MSEDWDEWDEYQERDAMLTPDPPPGPDRVEVVSHTGGCWIHINGKKSHAIPHNMSAEEFIAKLIYACKIRPDTLFWEIKFTFGNNIVVTRGFDQLWYPVPNGTWTAEYVEKLRKDGVFEPNMN